MCGGQIALERWSATLVHAPGCSRLYENMYYIIYNLYIYIYMYVFTT